MPPQIDKNEKLDLGFIMNQPDPHQPRPKKSNKKVIMLGSVATVFIILILVGTIFGKKPTTTQTTLPNTAQGSQFLIDVANNNADAAYAMYAPNTVADKDFFKQNFVQVFAAQFNLKGCSLQTDKSQATANQVKLQYQCPYADKSKTTPATIRITFDRSSSKITKVELNPTA